MSGKFQPIKWDTAYQLPPSVQDWLPENHLARFAVDIMDQLDLSELVKRYGGGGKEHCRPALLLALLFYGYAIGLLSSRRLEQATHDSVAMRNITADAHPDHDTIATLHEAKFKPRKDKDTKTGKIAAGHELKPPEAWLRNKDPVNFTDEESHILPSNTMIGFRRFHLRGQDAAQGKLNLVCMAWNLKRMYVFGEAEE